MDLRKLDTLIAEYIIGLEPWPEQHFNERAFRASIVLPHQTPKPCEAPHYSTDIAAAWDVVEKIRDDNFSLEEHGTHWKARFGTHWRGAETAPLAICLAALKVKGIDVSEWKIKE